LSKRLSIRWNGAYPKGVKQKYGNIVAPALYAPNHQHFFNVRCDFDLDGVENAVYEGAFS
jgi:primary-amine oxidase